MSQLFTTTLAHSAETPSLSSANSYALVPKVESNPFEEKARSVAFVDTSLAQVDQLIAGIEADQVVLINAEQNGIDLITQSLLQYNSLSSVHIFSHGSPGLLQLGNATLTANSLSHYSNQLSQWGDALLGGADLMLYGCDFTGSASGLALAQQISDLTGADVAASNNTTGADTLEEDWQLETHIGEIESAIALNLATQVAYAGTLQLLTNGDFEANLSNWSLFNGKETVTTTGALNGKSVRITGAAGGIGQIIPATAGTAYKLEGFARLTAASGYTGIGINFLDANRNVIGASKQNIAGDQWTAYKIEGTAGEGTKFIQVWAYKKASEGDLFLDNLVLSTATIEPPEPPPTSGQNQLVNPGFEAGLAPWRTLTGTETISTTAYAGTRSLQLTAAGSGASQIIEAIAGDELTLSLYSKTTNTGYVGAGFNFFDASYNRLNAKFSNEINIQGDSWKPYQQSSIAPDQTRYVKVRLYQADASGDTFIDQVSLSKSGSPAADTAAPTATLSAADLLSASNNNYDFTVTYQDATAVDISSIDQNDIVVVGPNGYQQNASLLSIAPSTNGTPRTATYRLTPPLPNGWTTTNNGTYTVRLKVGEIADTIGNQTVASNLGTFAVNIKPSSFGNIQIQNSNIRVNEAEGKASVTVTRTQGSDGVVTVDYGILSGSATANVDFTPMSGTLTFAAGETRKTVDINILNDSLAEGSESFGFAIDNVNGGATLLAPRTATVTILDDDTATYRGNQYLLTTGAKTWEEAQAEAESLGGNLVTINAPNEEAWLKDTFGTSEAFWIGLNDRATEGTFEWVSGEAVLYTNWAPGEPNNGNAGQDYVQMNYSSSRQWDDTIGSDRLQGIIEIGGNNGPGGLAEGDGNGLLGEYYNNINFTNPVLSRTDATINFDWKTGSPAPTIGNDTFSVRWSGRIEPRYSETYTFQTTSDDGIRLFINNQLVINKFIDQPPTTHAGTITLVAGRQYDIRLEYYERGGGALAQLAWSSPSQPLQIVPQSQLYSDPPQNEVVTAESVVSGLTQPTSIEWQPNTNRMFISEKGGIVKIFEDGALNANPFIDISDRVNSARDRGLLDIAIHPDFPNQPYVYLLYTYDPPEVFNHIGTQAGPDGKNNRAARLTRVTADASTNYTTAVPNSEVILLGKNSTWNNFNGFANSTDNFNEPPAGVLPDGSYLQDILVADSESHTIGGLAFGLDGALYVTNGDGASYNRVDSRATRVQDIDSLSGKVLRIDPITGAGLADNPFFNGNPNANRSKVWQYGLRNPFRITINENSGKVFLGEVGLSAWEEINSAGPGANFGWPYFEGGNGESLQTGGYNQLPAAIAFYNSGQPVTPALLALSHAQTGINAIVLGDIYTGNAYPNKYKGDLFFNDLGQGIVRNVSFDASGNITDVETFTTGAEIVVHIEQGPDGTLYYTNIARGEIGRWVVSTNTGNSHSPAPSTVPPLAPPAVVETHQKPESRPNFFLAP